jgi:excisionase family DNA binding protein
MPSQQALASDIERDALDERCPVHQVPEHVQCPVVGPCQNRRTIAAGRTWMRAFPPPPELDHAAVGQVTVMLLNARDLIKRQQDVIDRVPVPGEVMTPAEVAALLRVDPKTVTRWAQKGKLTTTRTPGGHRRFSTAEVRALLPDQGAEAQ